MNLISWDANLFYRNYHCPVLAPIMEKERFRLLRINAKKEKTVLVKALN